MSTILLKDVQTEDLNYLIMLISHGDDVGASLESIVAEKNRRVELWRNQFPSEGV